MAFSQTEFVRNFYSSVIESGDLEGTLYSVAMEFPEVFFGVHSQCTVTNNYHHLSWYNGEPGWSELFMEVAHLNPFPIVVTTAHPSRIIDSTEMLDPKSVETTEFYDHLKYANNGINRSYGILMFRRGTDSAFIAASPPGVYPERDEHRLKQFLKFSRPHLQNGFSLLLELKRRKTKKPSQQFWLNQLPALAMIVDKTGNIQLLNKRAETGLPGHHSFSCDNEIKLTARAPGQRSALNHLIGTACSSGLPTGPVRFVGPDKQQTTVFVLPISGPYEVAPLFQPFDCSTRQFLVLAFERDDVPPEFCDVLSKGLGLTARESAVVQQLIKGQSLREASYTLGITYNTARNHMATATEKVGAGSQTAIVKMGTQILSRAKTV